MATRIIIDSDESLAALVTAMGETQAALSRIEATQATILQRLSIIKRKETEMAGNIHEAVQRITQSVQNQTTVVNGAVTLLQQLGDLIRQNAEDPTALMSLADTVDGNVQQLSQAMAANTVADQSGGGTAPPPNTNPTPPVDNTGGGGTTTVPPDDTAAADTVPAENARRRR